MLLQRSLSLLRSFFFTDPPPTALYTLSLHDALPIYSCNESPPQRGPRTNLHFASIRLPPLGVFDRTALPGWRRITITSSAPRMVPWLGVAPCTDWRTPAASLHSSQEPQPTNAP